MGGVDQADRLRQAYYINRRSKKWWHRLFFGIVDIAFVNTLYKKLNPEEHLTLLDFRRGVALGLMSQTNNPVTNKKRGSASSANPRNSPQNSLVCAKRRKYNYSVSDDVRLSNRGVHWPIFTAKRGRCEQCSSVAVESRITTVFKMFKLLCISVCQ
ncbi:hypothetical protein JTB14_006332 [Gonioctena quinquepunctata]|nr:hypothetical protein JTB14_006332 [Gonioctena quinquepunctata]